MVERPESFENERTADNAGDNCDWNSIRSGDVRVNKKTVTQPSDRKTQEKGRMNLPRTFTTDRTPRCSLIVRQRFTEKHA